MPKYADLNPLLKFYFRHITGLEDEHANYVYLLEIRI